MKHKHASKRKAEEIPESMFTETTKCANEVHDAFMDLLCKMNPPIFATVVASMRVSAVGARVLGVISRQAFMDLAGKLYDLDSDVKHE